MTSQDGIKLLFTGSFVEAEYIRLALEENDIIPLERNALREGVKAGFGGASPENSTRLFVTEEDFPKASKILEDIQKDK